MKTFIALFTLLAAFHASAAEAPKGPKVVPACKSIENACRKAGFKDGAWKQGLGISLHCINGVMQGIKKPKGATKPLPNVKAADISKCKAADANFGTGTVGSP